VKRVQNPKAQAKRKSQRRPKNLQSHQVTILTIAMMTTFHHLHQNQEMQAQSQEKMRTVSQKTLKLQFQVMRKAPHLKDQVPMMLLLMNMRAICHHLHLLQAMILQVPSQACCCESV
jgi:hypothetical protein